MYMNPYTAGQFAHPPAQRTAPTPNLRHVFEDPQWLAAGQNSPMLPPQSQQSDVNYAPATMAAFPRSAGEIANTIACSAVTLTKTSERVKCFDHPSIPRLQPYDVEVDLAQRASGPPHFVPVSRLSMRPTYGVIPATNVLADSLQLPIGLHLHPFAESEIPLVDVGRMGISEIVRCRKCSAYINPFTTFTEGGRQWQCIMCKTMHITEEAYRCNMDPQTGLRTDIMDRPELFHCAVDFVATKSFLKRPPMRPTQLILLDCTFAAVQSGILQSMCTGALRALEAMKDDEVMRMGVVGFDSTVYFFNLRPSLSKPRMMAAPDTVADIVNVNDAFKLDPIELPCSISELVVPIKDSYHLLKDLFENLPQMLRDTKEVECAFGPALAAAITLTENSGAKILASLCSIPSSGDGKLKARFDVSKMSGQPKENTMCHAANDWYKQRALACSNSFISIDLVVNGSNNVDLATVAPLARFTSGSIFRVNAVSIGGLSEQVEYSLTRFLAFEAILRVRTSKGLMVPNFYGHCHVQKPELLALPVANADSTYAIELALGPDFKGSYAYIQYAVLYTSRARERLIRVHTVQLPVSLVLAQVVNSINSIGMATFLAKMAVDLAVKDPYKTAQERITSKLVTALANIKDNMQKRGVVAGAGQLLLPDSMKFIPQIVSSFFKFEAISVPHPQSLVQPDERVASMALVMTAPPESLLTFFLGWTYQLFAPNLSVEQQPCMVPSSQSCLCADGIYLMNLGRAIVIWVGDRSDSRVVEAFGITPANANGQNQRVHLSEEDLVGLRERVETVIWQQKVLAQSAYCGALEICHKGNTIIEPTLTRAMTEDDSPVKSTYSTYLLSLWEGVNKAMEGKK